MAKQPVQTGADTNKINPRRTSSVGAWTKHETKLFLSGANKCLVMSGECVNINKHKMHAFWSNAVKQQGNVGAEFKLQERTAENLGTKWASCKRVALYEKAVKFVTSRMDIKDGDKAVVMEETEKQPAPVAKADDAMNLSMPTDEALAQWTTAHCGNVSAMERNALCWKKLRGLCMEYFDIPEDALKEKKNVIMGAALAVSSGVMTGWAT